MNTFKSIPGGEAGESDRVTCRGGPHTWRKSADPPGHPRLTNSDEPQQLGTVCTNIDVFLSYPCFESLQHLNLSRFKSNFTDEGQT